MGEIMECPQCRRKLTVATWVEGESVRCPACGEQFAVRQKKPSSCLFQVPAEDPSACRLNIRAFPGTPDDETIRAEELARVWLRRARTIALLGYCGYFFAFAMWNLAIAEWHKQGKSMSLKHLKGIAFLATPGLMVGAIALQKRRTLLRDKELLRIDVAFHSLLRWGGLGGYIAIITGIIFITWDGFRLLREVLGLAT